MSERIKKCEHYLHFLTEETLVKEYILKPLIFMANWQKIYPVKKINNSNIFCLFFHRILYGHLLNIELYFP